MQRYLPPAHAQRRRNTSGQAAKEEDRRSELDGAGLIPFCSPQVWDIGQRSRVEKKMELWVKLLAKIHKNSNAWVPLGGRDRRGCRASQEARRPSCEGR